LREATIKFDRFLGKHMAIVIIVMVVLGYVLPMKRYSFQNLLLIVIFGIISFSTATGISFSTFVGQLKKPYLSLYTILLVHMACPVTAFLLGHIFYPGNMDVRTGLLISASVPMAATTLVWTAMSRGEVSLSILTVSIEAIIAPAIIPLCLWVVLGKAVELNYIDMIIQLLFMVTIPSFIGMWVRNYAGEAKINRVSVYLNALSKCLMLMIAYINSSSSLPGFTFSLSTIKLLLVIFLFVLSNYSVGFFGMSVFKGRTWEERVAGLFCCGLRNNGFAMIIALSYFEPATAIPLAFVMIVQQPFAGVMNRIILKRKEKMDALAQEAGG